MVLYNKPPLFGNVFNTVEPFIPPFRELEQKIFELSNPIPDVRTGINTLNQRYSTPIERDALKVLNVNLVQNDLSRNIPQIRIKPNNGWLYKQLESSIARGDADTTAKIRYLLNFN